MPLPAPIRLPLQYSPFRAEQFQTKEGISAFNLQWQQVINAINGATGNNGPAIIPGGVDVQGGSITGLGDPKGPTDAVSAGHASANYGSVAVGTQLDIGGQNTLKGLAYAYSALIPGNGVSGTVALAKLTGGGNNGSLTIANGVITKIVQPT